MFVPKITVEGLSIPTQKLITPQNLPRVMLTLATTYLYLAWNLHSGTCKDVIRSPLWYTIVLM